MKRWLLIGMIATAALVVAACGSSSGGSSSGSAPQAQTQASSTTVAVRQIGNTGAVLVDRTGRPLYTPEQEADGKVRCEGSCTSFWKPLAASSKAPTGPARAGRLGVLRRPDGTMQVTANGKPLYTFAQDAPGQVNGDGFSDHFGSNSFTWHAVLASGKPSTSSSGASPSRGGYSNGY